MIIEMKKNHEHDTTSKEVIIYESGSPVLKVETGTTLKVIKLLYEAEYDRKGQILGVRPKQYVEGIPCIATLDDSKLNELSYDILVSDEGNEKTNQSSDDDQTTTNRCLDCARASWKTKKFTTIGMNTEISINPLKEIDTGVFAPNEQQTAHKPHTPISNQNNNEKPQSNGTRPFSTSPTPIVSSAIYNNLPQKDYIAPLPNGKHHSENERARLSPSPTFGMEFYNNHFNATQIRYPVRPSMESLHYEHFIPSHAWTHPRSRYAHSRSPNHNHYSPDARGSPPRRSRSPISPRISEGYPVHFHGMRDKHMHMLHQPRYEHRSIHREELHVPMHQDHSEEKHHPHLSRDKAILRHDVAREIPPPLAEYSQRNDKTLRAIQPAEEPPVFVLPNDYDLINGIDPRLVSLQERRPIKSPPHLIIKEKELIKVHEDVPAKVDILKDEHQMSPHTSNGSESPKESNGSPEPLTNSLQKLYCKICNSVFPTKSLLYKHLRGHTSDEKPFKCNECGQGFTLSSNLRQHRIIHRGYKPFQCEFCGKKFMRSNVYKQHRRIHTGEEMHKCGLCPSEFLQKYALMKHMKKNHDIDAVDN